MLIDKRDFLSFVLKCLSLYQNIKASFNKYKYCNNINNTHRVKSLPVNEIEIKS